MRVQAAGRRAGARSRVGRTEGGGRAVTAARSSAPPPWQTDFGGINTRTDGRHETGFAERRADYYPFSTNLFSLVHIITRTSSSDRHHMANAIMAMLATAIFVWHRKHHTQPPPGSSIRGPTQVEVTVAQPESQ